MPSAGNKTLGKQQQDTRQRIDTRQKTATCAGRQPGCRPLELCRVSVSDTRQRESLPSVFMWHSANRFVCRVFYCDTRQIKKFFPPLALKLFLLSTYNMWYSMLRFGIYFWIYLLYLINLLYFKEFFGISQISTASDSNNRIK